jgi:acyl-CoA reductase-like NAD-dependent aldehyde dehydrogenase
MIWRDPTPDLPGVALVRREDPATGETRWRVADGAPDDGRAAARENESTDSSRTRCSPGRKLLAAAQSTAPATSKSPTVVSSVRADTRCMREETFGPIAPVTSFASEEQAVRAANDTHYGLVAYVYTKDVERALGVIERLDVGMVGLNQGLVSNPPAPFGGVKQSGLGRQGGREGTEEYLETKYLAMSA